MTAATRRTGPRIDDRDTVSYHYYFVRLTSQNPKDLFVKYPVLLETVKHTWSSVTNVYPQVNPDAFHVTAMNLDAIICVAKGLPDDEKQREEGFFSDLVAQSDGLPELVVEKAIDFFRSLCMHGWIRILHEEDIRTNLNFWDADYSVRLLKTEDEVEKIRSMLIRRKL